MEISKIDEQIKALQKRKKEAEKKQEEKFKNDFLKKVIGKDFEKISTILKSNPEAKFELYVNGKPFKEYNFNDDEIVENKESLIHIKASDKIKASKKRKINNNKKTK